MRKDYREPDDYEYEPTPHDDVLEKAKQHYAAAPATGRRGKHNGAIMMSSRAERSVVEGLRDTTSPVTPRDPSTPLGMTSRLDGELLEVSMGPQHPSTHGVFRMNVALDGEIVRQAQAGLRLPPSQSREDRREHQLPRLDAVHRSARLFLLDDEQLGLRAQRREARRHRSARARRILARHPGRADPPAKSRLAPRLSPQRHGRVGHAADVCLPRARENSRSLRVALRLAHDVQLHALRRLPRRCAAGLDGAGEEDRRCLPAISRRVRKADCLERNPDRAHPGDRQTFRRTGDQRRHHRPDAARQRRELRYPQSGRLRLLSALQIPGAARRSRRLLRSLDDARARDARKPRDSAAGVRTDSSRVRS